MSPRTGPGPAPAAPRPCRRGELPARTRPCGPVRGRAPRFLVDSVRGGAPPARCTDHPRLRVDRRAPGVPGPPGRSSGDVGGGAAVVELLARVWAAERPHMIVLDAARPRERRRRSHVPVADRLLPRLLEQRCGARSGCGRAGRHSRARVLPAARWSSDDLARPYAAVRRSCAAPSRRGWCRLRARRSSCCSAVAAPLGGGTVAATGFLPRGGAGSGASRFDCERRPHAGVSRHRPTLWPTPH